MALAKAEKFTAFCTVWVPVATIQVPSEAVSVPCPSGPENTPLALGAGLLLAASRRPPSIRFTPPVKVFWPLSCSTPAPVLLMVPVPMMAELMFNAELIVV